MKCACCGGGGVPGGESVCAVLVLDVVAGQVGVCLLHRSVLNCIIAICALSIYMFQYTFT